MEITEVKVFPIQEEKLKAFVSIVFDHCFMVNDIKVIQGRDGLFISMPSRKKKNGEFKDIAHPLNNEARRTIEDRILAAYRQTAEESGESAPSRPLGGLDGFGSVTTMDGSGGAAAYAGAERSVGGAPGSVARAPNATPTTPSADGKTLEELEELHLSDSFWSVT